MMIATKTRFDMAWEEILSNCEIISILELARRYSRDMNDFRLYVPIIRNLQCSKTPLPLKTRINEIAQASGLLQIYRSQCEPLLESTELWVLERAYDRIFQNRKISERMKAWKMERYPYLREIYPKVGSMINSLSPDAMGLAIQFVLSHASNDYLPGLTLHDTFDSFSRKGAFEIGRRFQKLLSKVKPDDSRQRRLLHFLEDCELRIPKEMNEYIVPYEESARVLPKWSHAEPVICSPLREVKSEEDPFFRPQLRDTPRFFKDFMYRGEASLTLVRDTEGDLKGCSFRRNLSNDERWDFVNATEITSFKYSLLYGQQSCIFQGLHDDCKKCTLVGTMRGRESGVEVSWEDCDMLGLLKGINVKVQRNP